MYNQGNGGRQTVQYVSSWFAFIDDCKWPEVPSRTRNDRNQLVLDRQMHLVDQLMNPVHNYIDLLVLENLELDYNSNQDTNIVLYWNYQQVYLLNYLIVIVLDHRNYLVDVDQLANLHLKQMLMKDRMIHTNEDRLKKKVNNIELN